MQKFSFLSPAQESLCRLLGHVLFENEFHPVPDTIWQEVLEESRKQAVTIPAFCNYGELNLDGETKKKVEGAVRERVLQSVQNYTCHSYLNYLMEENQIPYCVLKGVASDAYYPSQMTRSMGDVDFLVAKQDVDRASEVLEKDGFIPWEEEHICHIVFHKGKMYYEMHFEPAGVPNGAAGEVIRGYLKDIQETAKKYQDDAFAFYIPDDFHHGLILLLHMQHHLLSEGIGLRHLCDWAVFVNTFTEETFMSVFQKPLKKAGLWEFAKAMSLTAHVGLGLPYKNWMGEEMELAEALLSDVITGGNFGVKDEQRVYEGIFISNRGKDGVNHSRFIQLFLTLNQIAYTHWPVTRKLKILLPAGWVFFSCRRIGRIICGKRKKINVLSSYQKSEDRKKIYRQLKLFEMEKR